MIFLKQDCWGDPLKLETPREGDKREVIPRSKLYFEHKHSKQFISTFI